MDVKSVTLFPSPRSYFLNLIGWENGRKKIMTLSKKTIFIHHSLHEPFENKLSNYVKNFVLYPPFPLKQILYKMFIFYHRTDPLKSSGLGISRTERGEDILTGVGTQTLQTLNSYRMRN